MQSPDIADSSLNLGQAGNATNINGNKITLTHDSNNSVDVISKLTVKGSAGGKGVEVTDTLIKGANSHIYIFYLSIDF